MISAVYHSADKKKYPVNSDNSLLSKQGKIPGAYVSTRTAAKISDVYMKIKQGTWARKKPEVTLLQIIERARKEKFNESGGVYVYLYNNEIHFSKEITSRNPPFNHSLDNLIVEIMTEPIGTEEEEVELKLEEPSTQPSSFQLNQSQKS